MVCARTVLLAASLLSAIAVTVPARAQGTPLVKADDWAAYRDKFIQPDGRLVDDGNGGVSHTEGQGYGMLIAAMADDRATFARLWGWTSRELEVRGDSLAAWRWRPQDTPHVMDRNNATDGDLLIAWALAEAAERWGDAGYRTAARRTALAIARAAVSFQPIGRVVMPGVLGFGAADRPDGPVVNLSYWVFPAFDALARVAPEVEWSALRASGLSLLAKQQATRAGLPADWWSLKTNAPAQNFPPTFGYDAVRVPLYLAWGGADKAALAPFVSVWKDSGDPRPQVVDVLAGKIVEPFYDPGYRAVAALVRCVTYGDPFPAELRQPAFTTYYAATLHILSLAAARKRSPSCV